MASTFLDEKISSFIEDKFPEFVQKDHPVFVQFLKEYYKFLEAAKLTLTNPQEVDQILLENKLTTNYLANEEDGTKFVYEDSTYGPFQKDEIVTGQTSGATATILAEDNNNSVLYIEANRHFQVGEIIVGATSGGSATISKYQGNPVQNIQQLLEYSNVDKTVSDFLDHFRNSFLTAIPNTLATGVSKRKLVKSVRDLYRAKGSRKGHETFFRLMFNETPELTYPTENILKVSGGDWSSDTVLRILATENDPNNLVGQTISQTVNVGLEHGAASAAVEAILQLQEGESTVYQLILNVNSISGTFIAGAEISGIDNSDADTSISGTVQSILIGATVTNGAAGYTTEDKVNIASATGQNAIISIIDVGSGEVNQVIIDNPGSGYSVGDPLYFDGTNTEGAGASAIVSCVDGAIAPEAGDVAAYGMDLFDHIVYEDGTEATDAYTGNQIQIESGTLASLSATNEAGQVVNVTMFSRGSGYEKMPTIFPASHRLTYNQSALTTTGTFIAGETITSNATPAETAIIATAIPGKITITKRSGAFAGNQVITGSQSNAQATITTVTALGANATFLGWSPSGIGSITGVEVTNFGTGFTTAPAATVPIKMLLTRNTNVGSPPDITLSTAFSTGDTIVGQTSNARGTVTAWDNERQTLTVKTTLGTFQRSEILTRGAGTNYAIVSEISQGVLSTAIGTIGTTAGTYNNDKGKLSESLMKVQDSYYYQDFSYVVKVGAAIKDWRSEIKKAVHPAGFAMFGEVSITNKVATLMTVPVTGITSYTPTLASLFEAVLTTVVGRRLGTDLSGTAVPQSYPVQYQRIGDVKFTPDQQIVLEDATTSAEGGLPDYLILEDGGYLLNEGVGSTVGSLTTITNITTTNLATGQYIAGPSLPLGTTIVSIDTASSGLHNNGEITISQVALAATEQEWFSISVPYTTEYSIANTLLGETEIKGTTNHVAGTLKRGSHLGHEPQLFSTIESITRSGTTATVETTGPHGIQAGEQAEISGVDTDGYNGVYEVVSATDDTFTVTVPNTLTSPATVVAGVGKVKLVSPFDNSTRDVTLRSHKDVSIYPIYSGWWSGNQNNNYELFTVTGNTTSGSKTVTNITTTKINVGIPLGVIGAGIPTATRFDSITTEGINNNGTITLTHAATATATGVSLAFTGVTQVNRYGLGPRQVNAMKYMWATPPTEYAGVGTDTTENHQILLESSTVHNDEFLILEPEILPDVEFTVTVAGGKFVIDGTSQKTLEFDGARFYRFDVSDSSVNGHPFTFSEETAEGAEYTAEELGGEFNFQIELESGSYTEYSLLTDTRWKLLAEDGDNLTVQLYSRVTRYGTAGTAGAHVYIFTENIEQDLYYYCSNHSGMGSTISVTSRSGDYLINEAYQLGGAAAVENILLEDGGYILYETDTDPESQSIMVSEASTITYASVTEDAPSRMDDQMAYAYPNITRRESPESGTDNVDAGSAGVYDTTMTYTNIKIWDHESNVHNRISDFRDVRIVDVIKCGREFLEIGSQTNKHEGDNDYHFTIMEDGFHIQMESGSAGIPTTSRKIWNVPPPSYIRLTTS